MLRLALAPCGQIFQPPKQRGIAPGGPDPFPRLAWIEPVILWISELFHFCVEPCAAPGADQFFQYHRENLGQMRDIANGIFNLPIGQRAASPIGKTRTLVDCDPKPAFDQIGIADLLRLADRHHRNLRVKNRRGRGAGEVEDNLDILTAGVKDFQNFRCFGEQVEQRGHVEPFCQRINRSGLVLVTDLNKAQFRPIGVLAHEFGIDRDKVMFGKPFAQIR